MNKKELIREFAGVAKEAGFRVFLADRETYGFYTDADGSKIISFQAEHGWVSLSGNYRTDNPRKTGTGWRINDYVLDAAEIKEAFEEVAPRWAVGHSKWRYTTLEEHMKTYNPSSQYKEI